MPDAHAAPTMRAVRGASAWSALGPLPHLAAFVASPRPRPSSRRAHRTPATSAPSARGGGTAGAPRSARYRAGDVLALAAEIVARGRAARAPDVGLPASSVLGRGESLETKLDHVRLVGLGCRFEADDRERSVEILLADPDTGTVLVMDRVWTFAAGEAIPDAPELARRRFGPSSIAMLAKGQLVTRAAKRRANRALSIGTAQASSSVTPQTGDLGLLPRVDRVARARRRGLAARGEGGAGPRARARGRARDRRLRDPHRAGARTA